MAPSVHFLRSEWTENQGGMREKKSKASLRELKVVGQSAKRAHTLGWGTCFLTSPQLSGC
jgi:hypothetical protein